MRSPATKTGSPPQDLINLGSTASMPEGLAGREGPAPGRGPPGRREPLNASRAALRQQLARWVLTG